MSKPDPRHDVFGPAITHIQRAQMNKNTQPETEWIDVEPGDVQEGDEAYWIMPDGVERSAPVVCDVGGRPREMRCVEFIEGYVQPITNLHHFGVRFRRKVQRVPREWNMWACIAITGDLLGVFTDKCGDYSTKVRIIEVIE